MADQKHLEFRGDTWRFILRRGKDRIQKNLGTDSLSQARKMRDLYLATGTWHSMDMVHRGRAWRKAIETETDQEHSIGVHFEDVVTSIEDEHGPEAATVFARVADGESPILERLDAWHADKRVGVKLKDRTKADHRTAVTRFVAWLKSHKIDPFVPDITAKVTERYFEHLESTGIHPRTGNKALSSLRSMWTFMRINPNPWAGLNLDESASGDTDERGFTDDEVMRLFSGRANATMQNVMLIGCLTGARLEEIFKLKIADVRDGVFWVVNSKRKGPVTKRVVPIHPTLQPVIERLCKDRGADEYVIKEGDPTGWDGTRSMAFSKRFATYRRRCGVDEVLPGERRSKVNFHSFRRWLATALETAKVSEIVAARIIGHKLSTLTYGLYSDGADIGVLREGLEQVLLPPSAHVAEYRKHLKVRHG